MDEFLAEGVKVVIVSIGKPEIAKELVSHLGLTNGEEYLFVDPENALYNELDLNKGLKETFFSVSTPFAFLDRIVKKDGLKELIEVLGKWNKAVYIPPRLDQGFNQGGTFVFQGSRTIFAHYDESTAAHADIEQVLRLATANVVLGAQ